MAAEAWRREAREEDIQDAIDREVNSQSRRVRDVAFRAARELLQQGALTADIFGRVVRSLARLPQLQGDETPERVDAIRIRIGVETRLAEIERRAADEAARNLPSPTEEV